MTHIRQAADSRWRALGAAFLIAAIPATGIAVLETTLSLRAFAPSLLELLYGVNVHLAIACVVVAFVRLILWRMPDSSFIAAALGAYILAELCFTASLWIMKSPWMPPLATRAGKLSAACVVCAALLLGILFIRGMIRLFRSRRRSGWGAGRPGLAGSAFLLCFLLCNAALVTRHYAGSDREGARGSGVRNANRLQDAAPDVFIILVDALRFDHLSSYGYERATSPALDEFFRESQVFRNAYTPGNKTVPSIVSYFTGLHPASHRVIGPFAAFPRDVRTLAEQFRRYGFATAAFVGNMLVSEEHGFGRGFETFSPRGLPWWSYHGRTGVEELLSYVYVPEDAASGTRINRELFAWLDSHPRKPRFVYLHYMEPHAPYDPPAEDFDAVAAGEARGPAWPPMFHEYAAGGALEDWQSLADPPAIAASDRRGMVAAYDGEIHFADRSVGELLRELRRRGIYDGAHLVFLSDHGEEFGDHGGWFHGHSIYDELTRCPLAYRPPGGAAAGRIIERPVGVLDFMMTLFELLEMDPMPLHQGVPIPELLDVPAPAFRSPVVSSLPPQLYSCRLGPWKLIRRGDPAEPVYLLFDLAADPRETIDLAQALPDTLEMLRTALELTIAAHEESRIGSFQPEVDAKTLERLRSLGYVK